ncbi:MAG: hypothetical protein ACP5QK_06150 [Myxococcota bacterium]
MEEEKRKKRKASLLEMTILIIICVLFLYISPVISGGLLAFMFSETHQIL